jgi:hypothetical protein
MTSMPSQHSLVPDRAPMALRGRLLRSALCQNDYAARGHVYIFCCRSSTQVHRNTAWITTGWIQHVKEEEDHAQSGSFSPVNKYKGMCVQSVLWTSKAQIRLHRHKWCPAVRSQGVPNCITSCKTCAELEGISVTLSVASAGRASPR